MESLEVSPIGIVYCEQNQPTDSPRQASLAFDSKGYLELNSDIPLESLEDLNGFERVWLIYRFHENQNWKPKVRPPRGEEKRGVFATRSPYKPNFLGLSCVKLEKIEGRKVYFSEHDLLDQTPVFDIKPYIPYADSFPLARAGWIESLEAFEVTIEPDALEPLLWLEKRLSKPLIQTLKSQLSFEPTNSKIKRVRELSSNGYVFAYRTWRFEFKIDNLSLRIFKVSSGYSDLEMDDENDPYQDKNIHREFNKRFP